MERSREEICKNKAYQRNFGFWSEEEQEHISKAKVAVAGAGGDGYQLALKLAMAGVSAFSLADIEKFEPENSNRVVGATIENINNGINKAEALKNEILGINPDAKIEVFTDGVQPYNAKEFMNGADLILDESELTHLEIGTNIARNARESNIPTLMVMNLGFAALATSFRGNGGRTFEELMGVPKGASLDEVADIKVDFSRVLAYIPKYGDIRTLLAVEEGYSLPSIGSGVDVACAIGQAEALKHLNPKGQNHRMQPVWAPHFAYMDAYNFESGIIRHPRASYYKGVATVALRCALGINPLASYTKEDIERRNK